MLRIIKEYFKWFRNWDALCGRCGLCCYTRSRSSNGEVIINYYSPCEHFDKETRLCRVFNDRFKKCDHCSSVNIFRALFHPTLPPDCAYARTFRIWKKKLPKPESAADSYGEERVFGKS